MSEPYFFGRTLARRIDFFAFPRTGSHFLRHATAGLFDLVSLPQAATGNAEAASRREELNPEAVYALGLREEGVPYAPVYINGAANGQHGLPVMGEHPVLIMMRDPMPTLYSFYRVSRDRWGQEVDDPHKWARAKCARYVEFYEAGLAMAAREPERCLLLRFEEMVRSAEPLERLVRFVGVRPKLAPEFVFWLTRFETMAREGPRTFYRAGDTEAWRRDREWCAILERAGLPDLSRFETGTGGTEGRDGTVPAAAGRAAD